MYQTPEAQVVEVHSLHRFWRAPKIEKSDYWLRHVRP
jgi:hypothetical protein